MRWFIANSARRAITANTVSAGRLPRVIALLQDVHGRATAPAGRRSSTTSSVRTAPTYGGLPLLTQRYGWGTRDRGEAW
jgi:hypothetical protein